MLRRVRRSQTIATEPFEAFAVLLLHGAGGVEREAAGGGAEVLFRRCVVWWVEVEASGRWGSLGSDRGSQGDRQGVVQGGLLVVGVDVLVFVVGKVSGCDLGEPSEDAAAEAGGVLIGGLDPEV